ncbi:MAG TPA: hypothetical protein VLD19_09420, partial [Chitinophagaceae bacterium]|nr:hypothetical protein [Chitinophagaceae bacterium]
MTKRSAYLPLVCMAIPLAFASCATVMNRPVHSIRITTDPRIDRVDIGQAIRSDSSFYHNPGDPRDYLLARSRDTIRVSVLHHHVRDTLSLVARNSVAYWLNINCNYGLGMLVDRDNLKR